jgi:hypothetical protein
MISQVIYPEDRGRKFFRNVGTHLSTYLHCQDFESKLVCLRGDTVLFILSSMSVGVGLTLSMKHLYIPQPLASQTERTLPVTENASYEGDNFLDEKKSHSSFLLSRDLYCILKLAFCARAS